MVKSMVCSCGNDYCEHVQEDDLHLCCFCCAKQKNESLTEEEICNECYNAYMQITT